MNDKVSSEKAARDVSERKQAEVKMRSQADLLQKTFESITDALFILDAEVPPRITDCNRAASTIFRYQKEEMIGRTTAFLHVDEESLKKFQSLLYPFMEKGDLHFHLPEYKMKRKDGSVFHSEHSVSQLLDDEGKRIGWVSLVRDITERKEMEEKLKQYSEHLEELVQKRTEELLESEKRYSVLVEEASDGVFIAQDEKIAFVNKKFAETLGYPREELIGLPFEKLIGEKYRQHAKERYMRVLRGEKVQALYEAEAMTKNGERVPVEVASTLIHHQSRPADLVILRDVRERKRMEGERLKLEKLATIGEIATMVAHDLRNPLTSIRNASFYIKKTCPHQAGAGCKTALEMLDIIEQETIFANNIINDLLDLAAKRPLEKQRQDISNIIEATLLASNIPENIEVKRNLAKKAIANVDEKQMERVFLNLVKNAVQAMPKGGKLTIAASEKEDHVETTFTDSGTGIPEETISNLFQPLFTTRAKGTGMGLAICKKIVEQHGGTIEVKSKVGQGTTFIIKLPKKEAYNQ